MADLISAFEANETCELGTMVDAVFVFASDIRRSQFDEDRAVEEYHASQRR